MITETSAVAFRQNLGEMLNIVQYRNDSVLIKKDGKPVAALIDARLFERIRRMQERFDVLCDRLERSYAGVPEAVANAEIDAASTLARREAADAWRAAGRLPALAATPPPRAAVSAPDGGAKSSSAKTPSKTRR